jgi:thiol-disulfide isomerase/thioredoxin
LVRGPFLNISDEKIRDFYERHRETLFTTNTKVRVKAIITPTLEEANEAYQRAKAGEDFDELIAEYFLPYFAAHRKERHVGKGVDFPSVDPGNFWHGDRASGPLAGLKTGDISRPVPRFGKGKEYAVLKVMAERRGKVLALEEVRDNIYSRFWDELADRKMLQEVTLGRNPWCGTCRAGHNVNGQLWHLAQRYDEKGERGKAISACLLALHEVRVLSGPNEPTVNENGYYPEEQFLIDHGMDIMRYYIGSIDRVHAPAWLPWRVSNIKHKKVVPLFIRLVENRGPWCKSAAYGLGSIKAKAAIPALKDMLKDEHIRIVEHNRGDKESVYAQYYLRDAAREALKLMGEDTKGVKITIGKVYGDPLPKHQ